MTEVSKSAAFIRERIKVAPRVMIVLGSGLGELADQIEDAVRIPFAEIPGFHASAVVGHKGMLVAGRINGVESIAMQGRFHLYEGHSAQDAAFPIRVMAELGARILIVSNAAGGVNPTFRAGDMMVIDDHINFMFRNPLTGPVAEGDLRFPDMSEPYDKELRQLAFDVAKEQKLQLQRGVYFAVVGPSY
ncbi:MAG TPA: purine-nucleoside phosphorylase, partial [Longimicrobiales bacterium]|nr:purine-nucleoside phosphorylase [Longimicrobiales bacterium]